MRNRFAAALLVAAGLLVLGWLDHHAAEFDPHHTHIAPGLLGIALDLRMLPHTHAFAVDHSHGNQGVKLLLIVDRGQTVVSSAASLHAAGTKASTGILVVVDTPVAFRRHISAVMPLAALWFPDVTLEVPVPPPRPV